MIHRFLLPAFLGLALTFSAHGQSAANVQEGAAPPGAAPASISDMMQEAGRHYREGDMEAARQGYEAVLQQDSKSIAAYAGLARAYLKQEKLREAEEIVFKLAEFAADKPLVETARGEVYFREGKIAEAQNEFIKAANASPTEARPRLGLARILEAMSLYRRSKSMIEKAHQLDPEDPDIYAFWLNTLGRTEKIKELQAWLERGDRQDGTDREDVQRYLDYLKKEEAQPAHNCQLATKATSTETPLEYLLQDPTHMRGYALNVNINGRKARLMLDTGASGLLVSRGIGEKAGITKVFTSKVSGIGDKGGHETYVGYAESIKIGNLEFRDCPVEVIEKRSVLGDDGLIGADVFEHFLVDLDFPNRKLKLSELPKRPSETAQRVRLQASGGTSGYSQDEAGSDVKKSTGNPLARPAADEEGPKDRYIAPEMQSYARVLRFGHMLLVPTRINDVPDKLFLLDTGSLTNQISPDTAREITKVHNDPDMKVRGMSGSVKKVYSADKVVLQFGRLRQENQDLLSYDLSRLSRGAETEISGILGFVMLHFLEVKIDYRDGLVDFKYDPNGR